MDFWALLGHKNDVCIHISIITSMQAVFPMAILKDHQKKLTSEASKRQVCHKMPKVHWRMATRCYKSDLYIGIIESHGWVVGPCQPEINFGPYVQIFIWCAPLSRMRAHTLSHHRNAEARAL